MHSWRKTVPSVAWRTCSAADCEKMVKKVVKKRKKMKMEQQKREKENSKELYKGKGEGEQEYIPLHASPDVGDRPSYRLTDTRQRDSVPPHIL